MIFDQCIITVLDVFHYFSISVKMVELFDRHYEWSVHLLNMFAEAFLISLC